MSPRPAKEIEQHASTNSHLNMRASHNNCRVRTPPSAPRALPGPWCPTSGAPAAAAVIVVDAAVVVAAAAAAAPPSPLPSHPPPSSPWPRQVRAAQHLLQAGHATAPLSPFPLKLHALRSARYVLRNIYSKRAMLNEAAPPSPGGGGCQPEKLTPYLRYFV